MLIAFVAICVLVGLFGVIVWKQFKKPGKAPDPATIAGNENDNKEVEQKDPFVEDGKQKPPAQPNETLIAQNNEPQPMDGLGSGEPQQSAPNDPFANQSQPIEKPAGLFADSEVGRPTGLLDRRPQQPDSLLSDKDPLLEDKDPLLGSNEPQPMNPIDAQPMGRMKTEVAMGNEEPSIDLGGKKETTDSLFDDPLPNRRQIKPSIDTNGFSVTEETELRQPQPQPVIEQLEEPVRRAPATTHVGIDEPRTLTPDDEYVVKDGDSLWDISKKIYGTHGLFLALYEHNRDLCPKADLLKPGMRLRIPSCEVLRVKAVQVTGGVPDRPVGQIVNGATAVTTVARREALKPGVYETEKGLKVYRVGEGDTLRRIAQLHLGRAERWMQIYEMNRGTLKNEHDLQIGQQLRLPADASIEPLVTPIASGR